MQRRNIFIEWINEVTPVTLAEKLNVNRSTIHHWRRGHCQPSWEHLRLIRKLSRGRIQYEHIIDNPVFIEKQEG